MRRRRGLVLEHFSTAVRTSLEISASTYPGSTDDGFMLWWSFQLIELTHISCSGTEYSVSHFLFSSCFWNSPKMDESVPAASPRKTSCLHYGLGCKATDPPSPKQKELISVVSPCHGLVPRSTIPNTVCISCCDFC